MEDRCSPALEEHPYLHEEEEPFPALRPQSEQSHRKDRFQLESVRFHGDAP